MTNSASISTKDILEMRRENIGRLFLRASRLYSERMLTLLQERGHPGLGMAHITVLPHIDLGGTRPIVLAAAFDLGGRRVEVAHVGRGHTGSDLVVVVPDADLVVVGDLVESAAPPSLGPDSFLHEWSVTVDSVIGLMTGATRALPGHGDPVDRPYVYEQRGRLASISGELRRLAEAGTAAADVAEQGEWAYPLETLAPGLAVAYAQLGPVAPRRTLPLA
jgi:glyoxylase-like metal-dependent hydrolase (beta-lactamase superfamily II)